MRVAFWVWSSYRPWSWELSTLKRNARKMVLWDSSLEITFMESNHEMSEHTGLPPGRKDTQLEHSRFWWTGRSQQQFEREQLEKDNCNCNDTQKERTRPGEERCRHTSTSFFYPPKPPFICFPLWRSAFFSKWVSWKEAWHLRIQAFIEMCHWRQS